LEVAEQLERFQAFLALNRDKINDLATKDVKSFLIDFQELAKYDLELAELLLENPEETIRAAEQSLDHFDLQKSIRIRFSNLPESQQFLVRNIRSEDIGKLLSIEGIIRQASDVRPQVTSARFECPSCGNVISILQLDARFKEPSRCSCGRRGSFRLLSKDLVDAQHLKIEENPERLEGGEQPKRLSVFLKEDLVDPKMERRTTPGSKVRITGIIKEIPIFLAAGTQSTRFDLIMESNYIETIEETFFDIELNKKEEDEIKKLAKDPKVYERLVKSIAPSIYGHERIKEAIILQLMSGVRKIKSDGTIIRGDMHILLVGDPGAGKSILLQFVASAAPKARLIAGRGATSAGLTASVIKDEFLRGYALEAGALVLANKGVCCIDELDKMSDEDRSAMHQALEQQIVTIAKANIQSTLRAETTVLAAANPKLGRFDPYTPIASQIDLPSTLINRFDLIFPIRDIPNKELDEKIAKHVLKLQQKPTEIETELPVALLRRFIAYAKQKVVPVLSEEAIDEIKEFYVTLRNTETQGDEGIKPIPISARQLEALVRLSEGSAKTRLSKIVTKIDAKRAISILKYCLMQVGIDPETGKIDIDRISTGLSASDRGKIVSVKQIIAELEAKLGKMIPLEDIKAEALAKGLPEDKIYDTIEKLKRTGDIYEPKKNFISRV
jgi:replicative DNA helicase Mcm